MRKKSHGVSLVVKFLYLTGMFFLRFRIQISLAIFSGVMFFWCKKIVIYLIFLFLCEKFL